MAPPSVFRGAPGAAGGEAGAARSSPAPSRQRRRHCEDAGARRDVRAASDASGGRPLDAELRGAEEPICTHVSPRVHCNRCACAVDEKPINYRGMHGEHVRHNEEQTESKCMDVQVSLQLIDVSANGTFAAELLRLSTIGCHDATVRATSIKEPCPS